MRCLLFSSNEEMVEPIWQVLADLGIEGEYCKSAVDAVEKVTTQVFQIVITDWDDQPEAGFLLKTARELKAAQRPLTLAIVSDDARLPEALQAGANSVLVKPIRVEQVRDTMSTACELLRAKQQPGTLQAAPVAPREAPETMAFAAAALTGTASAPPTVTQAPEKTFRAGEFLQSPGSQPGGQFDTENEIHKSMEQAAAAEVDSLTDLEPMASAVEAPPAPEPEPQEPLTGWAALQARLTKAAPPPPPEDADAAPAKNELLSYGETPSYVAKPAAPAEEESRKPAKVESHQESAPEAALFAYISREKKEESEPPAREPRPILGKILVVGIAAACMALAALPRNRQTLQIAYRNAVRAGVSWLNPPPAPVAQAAPQHDSFGEAGDEYKLPTVPNIPDATTDPSQIRVLPVVDPTAKPQKGADANGGQAAATTGDNGGADQSQTNPNQTNPNPTNPNPTDQPSGQNPSGQAQANVGVSPGNTVEASPSPSSSGPVPTTGSGAASAQPSAPVALPAAPTRPPAAPAQSSAPPQAVPAGNSAGIPSSLKSQIASSTPDASGAMPAEAAMSSIEPVNLPESTAWGLLAQPVDPVYPDAAKASGQKGSVVLQVLIGRDGAVQDAKFLQGSLVFARAAIDAVKQWRFKPYSMNGRAVSVQSVITLNFKPPA
ncbi:MAG: TonB family protein [Candidatus Sulfotelmatobacter sp.]